MLDPTGGLYKYAYDEESSIVLSGNAPSNNLTSVTYPDGRRRVYWYNEQDKTANTDLPNALTGITDENGGRYATYTYNNLGYATSTEHANGMEKYVVNYPSFMGQSKVTDPLGSVYTYNFKSILGVVKSIGKTQGSSSASASNSIVYDSNGNISTYTDFNGGGLRLTPMT